MKLSTYICENLEIVVEKNIHYFKNRPPLALNDIPKDLAKKAVNADAKGYIKEISYHKEKVRIGDLKASQKELSISKLLTIAFNDFFEKGVPDQMGLIVSQDGYIIDGHHRWGAGVLTDPNKMVEIYKVNLEANQLISALNIVTRGHLERDGNISRGRIENFNPTFIRRMIMNGQQDKCLKKVGVERLNEYVHKLNLDNLNKACLDPKEDALKRVDMPVINDDDVEKVLELLKSGTIDFGIF